MKKADNFLVNENPNYRFADLPKMPDTQLVIALPKRYWVRLAEYINTYEAVHLAGRFGADPGDYEWEWVERPEAIRWWRRAADGQGYLCGMALAVRRGELVEMYGLVEVDETSPFWPEVIPEEAANAMPLRAKNMSHQTQRPEQDILADLYREYFRNRGMLTIVQPGEPALRKGTIREVERFRDALKGLLARSTQTFLPSEMNRK